MITEVEDIGGRCQLMGQGLALLEPTPSCRVLYTMECSRGRHLLFSTLGPAAISQRPFQSSNLRAFVGYVIYPPLLGTSCDGFGWMRPTIHTGLDEYEFGPTSTQQSYGGTLATILCLSSIFSSMVIRPPLRGLSHPPPELMHVSIHALASQNQTTLHTLALRFSHPLPSHTPSRDDPAQNALSTHHTLSKSSPFGTSPTSILSDRFPKAPKP